MRKGDPEPQSDTKIDATLGGVRRVEKVSTYGNSLTLNAHLSKDSLTEKDNRILIQKENNPYP